MGFGDIVKGVGKAAFEAGKIVATGSSSSRAPLKHDFSKGKEEKPQEIKDESVFAKGRGYTTESELLNWARNHKNEIYSMTKGRVTEAKLPEYVKGLVSKKFVTGGTIGQANVQSKERGIVKDLTKSRLWKASTGEKIYDAKEDISVAQKIFGQNQDKK